jgi:hypothetical protein
MMRGEIMGAYSINRRRRIQYVRAIRVPHADISVLSMALEGEENPNRILVILSVASVRTIHLDICLAVVLSKYGRFVTSGLPDTQGRRVLWNVSRTPPVD